MRAASLALLVGLAFSSPAAARDELAATLADAQAGASEPAELETLLRLQSASGRWQQAEATIERAAAAYRAMNSRRAWALTPWRVYVRARRFEVEGVPRQEALERAFAESVTALSDGDFSLVLPFYRPNCERLREAQTQAAQGCAGLAVDVCPQAAPLLAARQALAIWFYLLPASQRLLRAEVERRFIVEDDLLISMPDGARVAATLVRPRSGTAPLTALLNFTIYANDEGALAEAVQMAARGYAGMVAWSRGKGRSPGSAVPYVHDGADAAAVIDWLAARGWSDGRVGMLSGSYDASVQWAALKHRPRALRAIATHASNAPGIDTPMQGGVFHNFIYPWPLYTTDTAMLDEMNYGDSARWAALDRIWYMTGRPYRDRERIDGHANPIFRTWLDHPSYDDYWQRLIPVGDEFAGIDIPVFVQTGYYDGGMVGALHYFRQHLRHRPQADHRMLIGPYHHIAMGQGVLPNIAGEAIDEVALLDLREIRMQWLDHVFRGTPLPEILSARINYEVMGSNRWRHVDSLAAMADGRTRLYLSGRREGDRLRFADAAPGTADAPPVLSVDFSDRSDVDRQIPADALDTRNALVFATPPFAEPVEVAGAFSGRFELVINKRDFDLEIGFFEQRSDGRFFPLANHLARASYMGDPRRRRLLRPGRVETLALESQTVTARRLAAGSRIVAVVGVPKRPDTQINYGTGRDVSDESIADARKPLQILFRPGSYLELGVRRSPVEAAGGFADRR